MMMELVMISSGIAHLDCLFVCFINPKAKMCFSSRGASPRYNPRSSIILSTSALAVFPTARQPPAHCVISYSKNTHFKEIISNNSFTALYSEKAVAFQTIFHDSHRQDVFTSRR